MRDKLAVCVPWAIDTDCRFSETALNLVHPDNCDVQWFFGKGGNAAVRHNNAISKGLNWGANLILILGGDQTYPDRDMLVKLVGRYRSGCPCVTALVPMRGANVNQGSKPFEMVGWRIKQGVTLKNGKLDYSDFEPVSREKHGDLVQIHAGGSGVLLFPSDALSKLPRPWFTEQYKYPTFEREQCCDTPFLLKLQALAGLSIWCDTTIRVRHLYRFEIDETFSDRFEDWKENGGDTEICNYSNQVTTITQCRVSPSIPFFDKKFRTRYGLAPYNNQFSPAFFFGCYSDADLFAIQQHRGLAVVIWTGTDALNLTKYWGHVPAAQVLAAPNVRHVAISDFIAGDLDKCGLQYVRLPLCCVDESKFSPVERVGNKIYAMVPDDDAEKYGAEFIDKLKEMLPEFSWHIQRDRKSTPEEMAGIYADCFMGVRPVRHDGCSNTCVELGLMGRKVLWNGNMDCPNSITYDCIGDAAEKIREEYISTISPETISEETKLWINIGDDWKNVAFYDKPQVKLVDPGQDEYDYADYFEFRYGQGERGAGGPDPLSKEVEFTNQIVRDLLLRNGCHSVVEVGCGAMVRWNELPHRNYIGIDVSATALKHARHKFPNAAFLNSDVSKTNLQVDGDAVICIDVMQHIKNEDFEPFMVRMLNAAKKLLIVKTTPKMPENYNSFYQFQHDWGAAGASYSLEVPGAPHSRIYVFEKGQINGQEYSEGNEPVEQGCCGVAADQCGA